MRSGAIIFVEIPVRDLARAADFYAGLFGWSFEDDENVEGWHFTPGSGGPMGRILTSPLAGVGGIRFTVAVADIAGTTSRAIALGGGTAAGQTSWASDVGDFAMLIDPDGNRFGIFHGKLRGHSRGQPRSGVEDAG